MRSRKKIESDGKRVDMLILEVLLDIRALLLKQTQAEPLAPLYVKEPKKTK